MFDEKYLSEIGVNDLPLDVRTEVVEGLKQALYQRITDDAVKTLSQNEIRELVVMGSDDIDNTIIWLHEHVGNIYEIIDNAKRNLKQEILSQKQRALSMVK